MKYFEQRQIKEALAYAHAGGQAVHVCRSAQFVTMKAPAVFRRSAQFAHLFDEDVERLMKTARRLGVRIVKVERVNREGQHVDLCAKPLDRAIAECNTPELALG